MTKRVIIIAGPTACGKTALSLQLAKSINGEIISADSMQVYRGMDIGTAKVSAEERKIVPHHLIDIRDISESFNVVDFYHESKRCCDDILDRGKVPIIVGGTGFYLRAFLYGPPKGPPSDPNLRKELEKEAIEKGTEDLHRKLKELDPDYAATITHNDRQKIVRALEIIDITGRPVSSFSSEEQDTNYDCQCFFIYRPREILYKRVEERCDEMIEMGFVDEVKRLEKQGLRENSSASQSIGYRQCLDFLKTDGSRENFDKFVTLFKQASRRYVKRQFTWFRKELIFKWINVEEEQQFSVKIFPS